MFCFIDLLIYNSKLPKATNILLCVVLQFTVPFFVWNHRIPQTSNFISCLVSCLTQQKIQQILIALVNFIQIMLHIYT
jgi:hypothetical protein